jgi:hypothetical protein
MVTPGIGCWMSLPATWHKGVAGKGSPSGRRRPTALYLTWHSRQNAHAETGFCTGYPQLLMARGCNARSHRTRQRRPTPGNRPHLSDECRGRGLHQGHAERLRPVDQQQRPGDPSRCDSVGTDQQGARLRLAAKGSRPPAATQIAPHDDVLRIPPQIVGVHLLAADRTRYRGGVPSGRDGRGWCPWLPNWEGCPACRGT